MEWYHVYLFTRLDSLNVLITLVLIGLLIAALITGIIWSVNSDMAEYSEKYKATVVGAKKVFTWSLGIAGIVALVGVLIPSQKEVAAIYLLPKLAHSDFAKEASQLPADAAKLMRMKLESWISDMEPKKAEKK